MEFFEKGKEVRLRSHLDKYLVADDDGETVRQSHNMTSCKARWTVEFVEEKNQVLRLKSCHGRYLTASDAPFLLGVTGKRVTQSLPSSKWDSSVDWEPQKDGSQVKLKSWEGTFVRANGGTPPWRNSITHDVPHVKSTQDWVSWHVDSVELVDNPGDADYESQMSRSSSVSEELVGSEPNSPWSTASGKSSSNKFSFSSLMTKSSLPKSPKLSLTDTDKDNNSYEFFRSQMAKQGIKQDIVISVH